jgi:hypothetical protein
MQVGMHKRKPFNCAFVEDLLNNGPTYFLLDLAINDPQLLQVIRLTSLKDFEQLSDCFFVDAVLLEHNTFKEV